MGLADKAPEIYRKYWLNELSSTEQEALEERYFVEQDVFDSVLAAKQELILDYCHQRLSSATLQQFETYFLASVAHQSEVKLCQAMLALKAEPGKAQISAKAVTAKTHSWRDWFMSEVGGLSWGRIGMAVSSLLLCLTVGSWFYIRSKSLPAESVSAGVQSVPPAHGQQEFLLALSPETDEANTRSGQPGLTAPAMLGQEVGFIRLRLDIVALDVPACRVEIKNLQTKQLVWQSSLTLTPQQKDAELRLAREILPKADYRLTLLKEGQTTPALELARYRFDIRDQ